MKIEGLNKSCRETKVLNLIFPFKGESQTFLSNKYKLLITHFGFFFVFVFVFCFLFFFCFFFFFFFFFVKKKEIIFSLGNQECKKANLFYF
jgi:hypothetical protein